MITEGQAKLIWVLARQLGMDSDELHEAVSGVTGKDSIKGLSSNEAAKVIDSLVHAGGRVKKKRRPPRDLPYNVVELLSPKQARFIKYLEKKLGWQNEPDRLSGFIKRSIKRDVVRTKREAMKIIEGLKAMAEREEKKSPCPDLRTGKGSK
jgi:phage gp16-like protein